MEDPVSPDTNSRMNTAILPGIRSSYSNFSGGASWKASNMLYLDAWAALIGPHHRPPGFTLQSCTSTHKAVPFPGVPNTTVSSPGDIRRELAWMNSGNKETLEVADHEGRVAPFTQLIKTR